MDNYNDDIQIEKSKNINTKIDYYFSNGIRYPHRTSIPVIYFENDKYYLSSFEFLFTADEIRSGMINRPQRWILMDIFSGEKIELRDCKEQDFSTASFDKKYDIRLKEKKEISEDFYDKAFTLLDEIRMHIIANNNLDKEKYHEYMDMILTNIPTEYVQFFNDLSVDYK